MWRLGGVGDDLNNEGALENLKYTFWSERKLIG